jgi:hypothetical protein
MLRKIVFYSITLAMEMDEPSAFIRRPVVSSIN